jgi:hypothetical protein
VNRASDLAADAADRLALADYSGAALLMTAAVLAARAAQDALAVALGG